MWSHAYAHVLNIKCLPEKYRHEFSPTHSSRNSYFYRNQGRLPYQGRLPHQGRLPTRPTTLPFSPPYLIMQCGTHGCDQPLGHLGNCGILGSMIPTDPERREELRLHKDVNVRQFLTNSSKHDTNLGKFTAFSRDKVTKKVFPDAEFFCTGMKGRSEGYYEFYKTATEETFTVNIYDKQHHYPLDTIKKWYKKFKKNQETSKPSNTINKKKKKSHGPTTTAAAETMAMLATGESPRTTTSPFAIRVPTMEPAVPVMPAVSAEEVFKFITPEAREKTLATLKNDDLLFSNMEDALNAFQNESEALKKHFTECVIKNMIDGSLGQAMIKDKLHKFFKLEA